MTTKTELLNNGVVVATKTAAPFYSWGWTPASGASSLTYKRYEDGVPVFTSGALTGTVDAAAGGFSLSTISAEHLWHKLDIASTNADPVTVSTDSLNTTPYEIIPAIGTIPRSIQNTKECVSLSDDNFLKINNTELGSLFQNTFSINVQMKLLDGNPSSTAFFFSVYKDGSNRIWGYVTSTGVIGIGISTPTGGTFAVTASPVFANGAMADFAKVQLIFPSGGIIKIMVDGVSKPLSTTYPGDLSGAGMANLDLSGSSFYLGAGSQGSDAAAIITPSPGYYRQFAIQPVEYTSQNIIDLNTL